MVIKAIGKCIDTLPIADLLSQEEALADTVVFEVDRYYNGMDLSEFVFHMRGVTESGGETQTVLTTEASEKTLRLFWNVNAAFTAEAGILRLDLYASRYGANADAPEHILRYQLPPIQVRPLPESEGILESHSYTAFLLEVETVAEEAVNTINSLVEEVTGYSQLGVQVEALSAAVDAQNTNLNTHDAQIKLMAPAIQDNTARIMQLEERVDGMTPIVVLTQSAYDALESADEATLYIIKEDA